MSIGGVVGVILRSLGFCSEGLSAYNRIEKRIGTLLSMRND